MVTVIRGKKKVQLSSKGGEEKVKPIKDKQTRAEILRDLSIATGLKLVQVEAVFDELAGLIQGHMNKKGSGEFIVPKIGVKIRRRSRKRTKERKMVSPLTGEEVVIAAKPARNDIKLTALKQLKEAVE